MLDNYQQEILRRSGADSILGMEVIQELWSGYGSIVRVSLLGGDAGSVILKHIAAPIVSNHPRGWNTETSNARKLKSYGVEANWYKLYGHQCNDNCRVPRLIDFWEDQGGKFILLEDLNENGFPLRKSNLTMQEVHSCLKWLANFHATFLSVSPNNLWEVGTYWHLETRPDEFEQMKDSALKNAAQQIDDRLSSCSFSTFVHGDAKVANFCFGKTSEIVAAVDFQYVGGGCGMKDVAYFLGSVLGEEELELLEDDFLEAYFKFLREAVEDKHRDFVYPLLEAEWRELYPLAWADFTRFLLGWMPTHKKLNRYSKKMVKMALDLS